MTNLGLSRSGSVRAALPHVFVALLLVPAIAQTAVLPTPEFHPGEPITAADMNGNFVALASALSVVETRVPALPLFSESSGEFVDEADTPTPVPGLELEITTGSGPVRLELSPIGGGADSYVRLVDTGGGAYGYVIFERSSDGAAWTSISLSVLQGGAPGGSYFGITPSAFSLYDEPGSGTWRYRISVRDSGPASDFALQSVRLVATSFGVAP